MIVDPTIARLKSAADSLGGRVYGGADYLSVITSGKLPQAGLFAYVLYGGFAAAGEPSLGRGSYISSVGRGLKVALVIRTSDPTGARAIDELETTVQDVLEALCGWRPGNEPGVFVARNASVAGSQNGLLIAQIDFTIQDQLRFHQ